MPINYAAPALLESAPKFYTLALDGTIQRITLAKDVDGNQLDAAGTVNIWARNFSLQNSNRTADIVFFAYRKGGAPTTLDQTTAMCDIAIGQTIPSNLLLRSDDERLRGDEINLKDCYAKGPNGGYLHIIVPQRGTAA